MNVQGRTLLLSRTAPPGGALRGPAHAALLRRRLSRSGVRGAHLPQARRPGAHRRAQDQQRARPGAAGASAWASSASSPRRARASMASPRPPSAPCSAWSASSTWARWTSRRQSLNVFRMKLLGAEVRPVTAGSRTLKDAINEAMRDWVTNVATTHYLIGSAVGPHPYPHDRARLPVRHRPRRRARRSLEAEGRLPDYVVACVGGGSNAIGIFHPSSTTPRCALVGVEAGGRGRRQRQARRHARRGHGRACCTAALAICCRTPTAR